MSDAPQGPGWWLASDGNWYPPQPPLPPTPPDPWAAPDSDHGQGPAPYGQGPAQYSQGPPEYGQGPAPFSPPVSGFGPPPGRYLPPPAKTPDPVVMAPHVPEVGTMLSDAFGRLQDHAAPLLLTVLGFFVLAVAGYVGGLIGTFSTAPSSRCVDYSDYSGRCVDYVSTPASGPWALWLTLGLVLLVIGMALGELLLSRLALQALDGGPVRFGTAWSSPNAGRFLGTWLLVGLVTLIGLVLCIVPGLIAAVAFRFAPYFALDRGLGPIASMRASVDLVKLNLGRVLLVLLVVVGLGYAGMQVCYIGVIATWPLCSLCLAYVYRRGSGGPVTPRAT